MYVLLTPLTTQLQIRVHVLLLSHPALPTALTAAPAILHPFTTQQQTLASPTAQPLPMLIPQIMPLATVHATPHSTMM